MSLKTSPHDPTYLCAFDGLPALGNDHIKKSPVKIASSLLEYTYVASSVSPFPCMRFIHCH